MTKRHSSTLLLAIGVAFAAPAWPAVNAAALLPPPSHVAVTTICTYHFADAAVGWRSHTWTYDDCSNGLPQSGWVGVGQGENGAGKSGQVQCTVPAGYHYNHPVVGATDATVRCFFAPPSGGPRPSPPVTTCAYTFSDVTTGWRTHPWTAADCSNGLPSWGWLGIGQGANGGGTAGMVSCDSSSGSHYNHPTLDGATSGTVICTFVGTSANDVTPPELTACDHVFPEAASGWRTHAWTAADCTNGLPKDTAWAVGQATNGSGGMQQASCSPASGSHYNPGATSGGVRCLFQNAEAPPPCTYSIAPQSVSVPSTGSSGTIAVSTRSSCSWSAASQAAWIHVTSGSTGVGTGNVTYSVDANYAGARTGTISVAGSTFTVNQGAGSPPLGAATTCTYHFAEAAVGWRSHNWLAGDCSHGLPQAGWTGVGQGENGVGKSGQVQCTTSAGSHYNHPTKVGATDATVTCFFAPPGGQPQPLPPATTCRYTFSDITTGSRTHPWAAADCSNGLPQPGSIGVGQGMNGGGTAGMVWCDSTSGTHYNHPTDDGATSGAVICTFLEPAPQTSPELTSCEHFFPDDASGWRTYNWQPADCSHGLPNANAWAVGQATNGSGEMQQASCSPVSGSHYNTRVTKGRVRCLFQNADVAPPCRYTISPQSVSVPSTGASGTVTVSTRSSCSWPAASQAGWIHVLSGSTGVGTGNVTYSVDANEAADRTGTISVAGSTFTVNQAAGSPRSLRYFGYWRESDFENYICEIQDHANYTMIGGTLYDPLDINPNDPRFAQALNYGLSSWGIYGPNALNAYLALDDADGTDCNHTCTPTWTPQGWAEMKVRLQNLAVSLKGTYPNVRPYINLTGGFRYTAGFSLPAGYDWIGMECYQGVAECQNRVNALKPLLPPNGRVWVLPLGIVSPGSYSEAELVQQAQDFYDWAKNEPAIIGFTVFVWQTTMVDPPALAVRDLPNLKAKYREIGNLITGRNRPPLTNCPVP